MADKVNQVHVWEKGKARPKPNPEADNLHWWKETGDQLAQSVSSVLKVLERMQLVRIQRNILNTRLYGNLPTFGTYAGYTSIAATKTPPLDRITLNLVGMLVDTVVSKSAKVKPRPFFFTKRGNWKESRKATDLTQLIDGIFFENKAYDLGQLIDRDACVFGTGVAHVFEKDGRVCIERALAHELWVDEFEAWYGEPRSLHWGRIIDRQVLKALYPGSAEEIQNAKASGFDQRGTFGITADMVSVRESWHLPSSPTAKDGLHAITIDGHTLFRETWTKQRFPFVFLHWLPRIFGMWAISIAEQVQSIQFEINRILYSIQKSYHLSGTFRIWLPTGSRISKEHVNNEIGLIIESAIKPEYLLAPVVQPEIYEHLTTLVQRGFDQVGVSPLDATSQKPAGLNSGEAIRTYEDIQSERFTSWGHQKEKFFIELAELCILQAKEILEEKKSFRVSNPNGKFLADVDLKDVDLPHEDYVLQVFPTSSLPNEPAGRRQEIQEWIQAGIVDPRMGRRLMAIPDLEMNESLADAQEEWLLQVFDKITDDGEYTAPEVYDNLKLARELALQYYAYGKARNLEPERLELLRKYLSQLDWFDTQAQQQQLAAVAQAQAQAAQPVQPQAQPQPQPRSDLVQNVPGPGQA